MNKRAVSSRGRIRTRYIVLLSSFVLLATLVLLSLTFKWHAAALYWIGDICWDRNNLEGAKWYERSAMAGSQKGRLKIAEMYYLGYIVPEDKPYGLAWYKIAAEDGSTTAMHRIAEKYISGWGVPKDIPEAVKWYTRAAQAGDLMAAFNLAQMYDHGNYVSRDVPEAIRWYQRASELGDEYAIQHIMHLRASTQPATRP